MKIAIMAAGKSEYFPILIDKPKCLYHLNGQIQLDRVIKDALQIVKEEDIIVVAGYKYKFIARFLIKNYPKIKLKVNFRYNESAVYSFRKAIENEEDDIVFLLADESISIKNIKRICASNRKMAILTHDKYYYYSLGIIKLRKDQLNLLLDDKYLSMDAMKEIYCFANNKTAFDGTFSINSGICMGYMVIDFVRRIGGITKIENPITSYHGTDIDFVHYDPQNEYVADLDFIYDTDEYKKNYILKAYTRLFSNPIKKAIKHIKKT